MRELLQGSVTVFQVCCVCVCAEWSPDEVVEKYLKPTNMEYLAKIFAENRINGAVLLALEVRGRGGRTDLSCLEVIFYNDLHVY